MYAAITEFILQQGWGFPLIKVQEKHNFWAAAACQWSVHRSARCSMAASSSTLHRTRLIRMPNLTSHHRVAPGAALFNSSQNVRSKTSQKCLT